MKKIVSKLVSIFVAVCILFIYSCSSLAYNDLSKENDYIITLTTDNDIIEYANKVFYKHVIALDDYSLSEIKNGRLKLGKPFTLFNPIQNDMSYCFPIVNDKKIVSILEVIRNNHEFSSSFSTSFSKELGDLLSKEEGNGYYLLTDGTNIQAYNGLSSITLFRLYPNSNNSVLSKLFSIPTESKSHLTLDEIINEDRYNYINTMNLSFEKIRPFGIAKPYEGKTLNVKGVKQGDNPWCWAATTAALINYYKGTSLTAYNIAKYVFPNNPNKGAIWSEMKKAYNHWKLYPLQTRTIGFNSVKSNINANKPMHLGLKGHSVALIGYEHWMENYGGDRILILLEPNGGIKKSVTVNSKGNFYYKLGGGSSAWVYTRKF